MSSFFLSRGMAGLTATAMLALLLGGVVGAADTGAGEITWTNEAKDSNWSTATNWSGHTLPGHEAQVRINGNSTEADPVKCSGLTGVIRDLNLDAGYLEISGALPTSIGCQIGGVPGVAEVTIDAKGALGTSYVGLGLGGVDNSTAIVNLRGGNLSGSIFVGVSPGATAVIKGFGTVSSVNPASVLTMKGQVVASGGTLTLSNLSSSFVTGQNRAGNAGWYAVAGGRLVSEFGASTSGPTGEGVWVWGDQAADYGALTMVNSVAIRYKAEDPTWQYGMGVTLLASDNSAAHPAPAGTAFIGYWNIVAASGPKNLALLGLNFRYDDALAKGAEPSIYSWAAGHWNKLSTRFNRPGFDCYYAGEDPVSWGDFALGIDSAAAPVVK